MTLILKNTLKTFCCLVLLLSVSGSSYGQKAPLIDNDSLLKIYLGQSKFDIDTAASAIILSEKMNVRLSINSLHDRYYQTARITQERYIKINAQQARDLADIEIPYSKQLRLSNLECQSINLVNGQVVREKVRKKDLLKEKVVGDVKLYKLNFPNVKTGSIIYFTYTYDIELGRTIMSEYFSLDHDFQSTYPTLDSRFELTIPYEIDYKAIPKNVTFRKVSSAEEIETDSSASFYDVVAIEDARESRNYNHITWKRSNIKGLRADDYILNPEHKMEKMTLYLSSYFPNPYYRSTKKILTSWEEANKSHFYDHPYLGEPVFHPDDTLSYVIDKAASGATDNLKMAQSIYRYVRDSIECSGYSRYNRVWANRLPKNVLRKGKGTISDINILLTALYQKAGIKSFPVVLCTADKDKIDESHFEPDALNYLICLVIIEDNYYFLDASSKFLPFGVLEPKCYNGFAWLINEKGLAVSMNPDRLLEKSVCLATATPGKHKGLYDLQIEQKLGNVAGPAMRALWAEDSAAVKKSLEQKISKLEYATQLKHYTITNIGNPDTSLIVRYELELRLDTTGSLTYLNPFFQKYFTSNPFTENNRKFPVEFGHAFNYQFLLKLHLADSCTIEDYNNPAALSFNNDAIQYRNNMQYDKELHLYSMSSSISAQTSAIAPEDYGQLRSFFDRIITEQNKKLVIRKTRQ